MSECRCELSGFCTSRNIALKPTLQMICRENRSRIDDMLEEQKPLEDRKVLPPREREKKSRRSSVRRELVGTALESRIERTLKLKTGKGCGCQKLVDKMNSWGISGCQSNRKEIIATLMIHRQEMGVSFAQSAFNFATSMGVLGSLKLGAKLIGDFIEQKDVSTEAEVAGCNWLLDRAIEDTRTVPGKQISRSGQNAPHRGIRGAFAAGSGPARFVRSSQFQIDILNLIGKIPPDITAIAGVARSGLSAATMLSMYLHLPMVTIRQTMGDVVQTGNGWRLGGSKHVNPRTEKILVVDDTVMTGNSLKAIKPLIDREFGNAVYAAIYVNPKAMLKPDIWSVDLPWPHILEWNVFNSVLSPSAATDFDGILCHDCPPGSDDDGPKYLDFIRNAMPLYTPRKCPIPLIVTARIERYRADTEDWLRRHGIRWNRLVMHPAATLRERQRDNIAAYKARHYAEWAANHRATPGPIIFFESEDGQAREIAKLSKLLTVCPHTAGCY